jgi:hypothetical protein
MSEQPGQQPTEEELRAALEEELRRLTVDDVLLQTVVTLINLAGRKAGLAPGSEDERDAEQLHQAIEAVRTLLPLVEPSLGPDAARVRDALSQLQLAYARLAGGPPEQPADAPGKADQATGQGPAQSSGRLWVPGQ